MKDEKVFKDLLWFSAVRGMDSTGVGGVSRIVKDGTRDIRLAKETGPPWYLFDTKQFDKVMYGNNQVLMGHNRFKTTGEVNRKNAHPFLFEDILGAHNGTIDYQNKNRLERGGEFRTDSEAIFNNIQVHGIEDTIGRIEKSEAYSLTWYDARDNTINFLRNEHRPLYFIYSKSMKSLYWASEYELLMPALWRQGIELVPKAVTTNPDTHYSWVLPESSQSILPEPTRKKYKNHTFITTYQGSMWKNNKNNPNNMGAMGASFADYDGWGEMVGNDPYDTTEVITVVAEETAKEGHKATEGSGDACLLPQDKKTGLMTRIRQAIADSSELSGIVSKVTETKLTSHEESFRKMKYEELRKNGLITDKLPLLYKNSDGSFIVHRDKDSGQYVSYRWEEARQEYARWLTKNPPLDMPFTIVDINSRHTFEHTGKGKNKKIFYKGFKKKLLSQDSFNDYMQQGCLSCSRKPEWGNEVVFLDEQHAFLCEFCKSTPYLLQDLMAKRKRAG